VDDHPIGNGDYLAMLTHPGVPNHELKLKVGSVCLLMRNLSVKTGLVKNARVLIKDLRQHYAMVSVLDEDGRDTVGEPALIPRINFEFEPPYTNFTVFRKQLALRLAYATTFNSCQGLTLDKVAIDIRTAVFAHGQLYTALSRIRNRHDAQVLINPVDFDGTTKNVVYPSLLL
jgi:ATP-dependent exoDNAse (exonuclease V) alpha subunit